jgi:hypothetical protein
VLLVGVLMRHRKILGASACGVISRVHCRAMSYSWALWTSNDSVLSCGIIKLSIIYHPQNLEFWADTPRHTAEQYGVQVEIPTEAHRASHSSTCSILTRYSWPCFESNGFLFGRRYALSMPTPCPAKLSTPSWEEQTLYRICSGVVPCGCAWVCTHMACDWSMGRGRAAGSAR